AVGGLQPPRAPIEALIGLSIALVAAENVWLVGGRRRVLPVTLVATLAGLALVAVAGHGHLPALTLVGLAVFAASYFALLDRMARPAALRAAAAFVFGLVHGLGFAGVLIEAHLEPAHVVRALLGFNAGVEVGQLAVVALAWPALRAVVGRRPLAVELASAAVGGLGVFWFVTRAYG